MIEIDHNSLGISYVRGGAALCSQVIHLDHVGHVQVKMVVSDERPILDPRLGRLQ
jgi:hypothetical protein